MHGMDRKFTPDFVESRDAMSDKTKRTFYLIVGYIFVGIGFLGALLPVLPTVPFLLIAVWAFSKSSDRLKEWLYTHPVYGTHITAWFEKGAMTKKAKFFSIFFMFISLSILTYLSPNFYIPSIVGCIMIGVSMYILTRPIHDVGEVENLPPPFVSSSLASEDKKG